MSAIFAGVAVSAISLLVGWIGLWPLRRRIGAWGYHVAAFPIGFLGWSVVAVISAVLRWPFDWRSTFLGLALFVVMLWLLPRKALREADPTRPVPWWSYLTFGGAFLAYGVLAAAGRLTISTADGWGAYWPFSILLGRSGELTPLIFTDRGLPLVAMGAADILFGGQWAYVEYQIFAAAVLLTLGWLVAHEAVPRVGRTLGIVIAVAAAAVLAVDATFVFNIFYVHSHTLSALYLMLSLGALRMAVEPGTGRAAPGAGVWFVLSGLSTAGVVLARPDGFLYAMLPVILFVAILTDEQWQGPGERHFFTSMLIPVYIVFAAAFLRLGVWYGHKLNGRVALVALVCLSATAGLPWLVDRFGRRFSIRGQRVLPVALALAGLLLGVAFLIERRLLSRAVVALSMNLFGGTGGWGPMWFWLVGLMLLTVLSADALRSRSWTRPLFFTITLFVVLTFIANMSRGGRPGWGDSMNRIMLHIVPVIVWYIGLVVARIVGDMLARRRSRLR